MNQDKIQVLVYMQTAGVEGRAEMPGATVDRLCVTKQLRSGINISMAKKTENNYMPS